MGKEINRDHRRNGEKGGCLPQLKYKLHKRLKHEEKQALPIYYFNFFGFMYLLLMYVNFQRKLLYSNLLYNAELSIILPSYTILMEANGRRRNGSVDTLIKLAVQLRREAFGIQNLLAIVSYLLDYSA